MSKDIKHGDSGIFTAEGNVAGPRAAKMAAQREKQKAEFARKKAEIEKANSRRLGGMDSKFAARTLESSETDFKVRDAAPRRCCVVAVCVYVCTFMLQPYALSPLQRALVTCMTVARAVTLQQKTYGLVTADEFKKAREDKEKAEALAAAWYAHPPFSWAVRGGARKPLQWR